MAVIYPFSAIVGQEQMRRALTLNAVDPRIGGVLIRGERGTAKSTAARALAELLPEVEVVQGCRFGCDPHNPAAWCSECKERSLTENPLPVTTRPTPFINLPVSATEDRVVGTLDIEKAIQKGERHFEAGVLAAANRGLLYIDEVNLLDDHVVDILLDSAAMGMNIIEREGISFSHPSRFILVGTMNPEEGDLRPQLLDRFALSVDIKGIRDPRDRVTIMERHMAFEESPEHFREEWLEQEHALGKKILAARNLVEKVVHTSRDLISIASLTSSLSLEGHRSDLVILKTARAQAALEGRTRITDLDIALAAELALPHRLKRGPFMESDMTAEELEERIEQLRGAVKSTEKGDGEESDNNNENGTPDDKKKA